MADIDQYFVVVPPETMEELEDLRTFVWLLAERAYSFTDSGEYFTQLGYWVSAGLMRAFDV